MKILIIQEAGRHEENWHYRESQCIDRALQRAGHEAICWGIGYKTYETDVQKLIDICDGVLVLEQYNGEKWLPIDELHDTKKPKFFWTIDSHCNIVNHVMVCGMCKFDIIFCSNLRDVPLMQKYCTLAQWLPNAYPNDLIDVNPAAVRTVDIGYCGTPGSPARQEMITALMSGVLLHTDIMVLGDAMALAIGGYKISWNRNVSYDINYRTFESMGAGAMLLTNETSGVKILFDDKKDCVFYNDLQDCIDKTRYYLAHDTERLAIARAGYSDVKANHTYDNRAQQIVKMFKEFQ